MKSIHTIKEMVADFLAINAQSWWIEVTTESPRCTYYFGPFPNHQEAEIMHSDYIEDLQMEGAEQIQFAIKRCKPKKLTVFDEEL